MYCKNDNSVLDDISAILTIADNLKKINHMIPNKIWVCVTLAHKH